MQLWTNCKNFYQLELHQCVMTDKKQWVNVLITCKIIMIQQ